MTQDQVTRLSDVEKSAWSEDGTSPAPAKPAYVPGYGERWSKARATKKVVFWTVIGAVVLTMFVGFRWGGWVTGGSAQKMTETAVAQRLTSICVGQFNQDSQRDLKFTELKGTSSYQRDDYVIEQGWATMPGDEAKPDSNVANECAKLIVQNGP